MPEARVTLICTRSKGLIPASNNAFPAVPDDAHIKAAVTTHKYPLAELLFPGLKSLSLLGRYYQVPIGWSIKIPCPSDSRKDRGLDNLARQESDLSYLMIPMPASTDSMTAAAMTEPT